MKINHVLVVDDDPIISDYISLILSSNDFSCATASRGAEAIDYVKNNPVDLSVIDIHMPVSVVRLNGT